MRTYINTTARAIALVLSSGHTVWCNSTGEGFYYGEGICSYDSAYHYAEAILGNSERRTFYYYEDEEV